MDRPEISTERVRTYLTAILGNMELALLVPPGDERLRLLEEARRAARLLSSACEAAERAYCERRGGAG
jgi:hypothetical protein